MRSGATAQAVAEFLARSGRFGVAVLDPGGVVVERFGALVEQVEIGEDGDEAFPFLGGLEDEFERVRSGEETHLHLPNVNLATADGTLLFTSVFLAPGAEPGHLTVVIQDTSEASRTHRQMMQQRNELDIARRELEEANRELEEARARAEDATRAKSRFLAMMTHEIRTPMNGVLGMLQLIDDGTLDARKAEFARTARGSAEALLQIIGDILDFSKIEAGRLDVESVAFDLRETVRAVVQLLEPRADEKGIGLDTELTSRLPDAVIGDPVRVRQILLNLIGNAIKFTSTGGVRLHVDRLEWDGASAAPSWRFEVIDTGIGISDEGRTRLFEEFSQTDSSTTRRFGGTGLGLAISKRLVELMRGRIGVDSIEGEGSTFWFELPLEPTTADAIVREGSIVAPVVVGARILLVDDNLVNRQVGTAMLEEAGYRVGTAEDGAGAVAEAEGDAWDAVLMDLNMPVMDGRAAAAEIRSRGLTLPILAMTAHARSEAGDLADFDGYVGKPVRRDDLLTRLAEALTAAGVEVRAAGPAGDEASTSPSNTRPSPGDPGRRPGDPDALSGDPDALSGDAHALPGDPKARTLPDDPDARVAALGLHESDRFAPRALAAFQNDMGEEVFVTLVDTYLRETRRRVDELTDHFESGAVDVLERHAHDIKSCADTLGARLLRDAAKELEFAARDGELNRLDPMVSAVVRLAHEVYPEIEATRDALAG